MLSKIFQTKIQNISSSSKLSIVFTYSSFWLVGLADPLKAMALSFIR